MLINFTITHDATGSAVATPLGKWNSLATLLYDVPCGSLTLQNHAALGSLADLLTHLQHSAPCTIPSRHGRTSHGHAAHSVTWHASFSSIISSVFLTLHETNRCHPHTSRCIHNAYCTALYGTSN